MLILIPFIVLIIIVFIVLVASLNKIFNRDVGAATAHLDQMSAEYAKKEQDIKKQYDDIKREAQEIKELALKDAEQQKQRLLKEMQDEKEKILKEAQGKADEMMVQAARARNALIAEIEEKIKDKGIHWSVQLLQEVVPENIRIVIHERWIDELIASNFAQLDRLHISEGIQEAGVVTAFALTDTQRAALAGKINEKVGFAVTLKESIDPNVIAGWVVSIGSLVLDGSLRFKIQEAAKAHQLSKM
ncbi:MAG: F0F1 ATP synthase subunit delta [Candidatus Omnitrophota bacterium]